MKMKKILLYSGGMDSWLIDRIWRPDVRMYVDMHTRYSEQELATIHGRPDVQVVDFPLGRWEREDRIIPLRNLFLVMVACNQVEGDVEVCLGATAGDRVLDKSPEFAKRAGDILNYLFQPQWWIPKGRTIRVSVDFKNCTKVDLLRRFVSLGGDLHEAFTQSFSCYCPTADGRPCWSCKPCFRKFVAFAELGYGFDEDVLKSVIPYIWREIVPQIKNGSYGRGQREEEVIMDVANRYGEYR